MSDHSAIDCFLDQEVSSFQRDGYFVASGIMPATYIETMKQITQRDMMAHQGDIEYEAELNYPGAPQSLDAEGGRTARRLRQAISRDPVFLKLVSEPFLSESTPAVAGSTCCHAPRSSQLHYDQAASLQQRHWLASGYSLLVIYQWRTGQHLDRPGPRVTS
jgi:hypothetical protein